MDRVDVFVQQLLPLELLAADPALETLPGPLVFRAVALGVLEMSPQVLGKYFSKNISEKIFHCKYFSKNISVKIFHLGSLPTVGAGPDVLLRVNPSDVSV